GITPAISQEISEPSARSSQALADEFGFSHYYQKSSYNPITGTAEQTTFLRPPYLFVVYRAANLSGGTNAAAPLIAGLLGHTTYTHLYLACV
ncbi:MAG TPA: hypothetical protein VEL11_00590, partial [Candidatus Bathyarchaeia archaeon]|nr:hypothetical protein [Candidatus Bathyarchaeia archaeon]